MWWWMTMTLAMAAPEEERAVELVGASARAQTAFVELEPEAFAQEVDRVRRVGEAWPGVITPASAAAWHKAESLWTYAKGDDGALVRHVMAALRLDPYWSSPLVLELPTPSSDTLNLRSPVAVWVDGQRVGGGPLRPMVRLPRDRAMVLQVGRRPEGADYVLDGSALQGSTDWMDHQAVDRARTRQKTGRIVGSAVGAALVATSAVLWGVAVDQSAGFRDGTVDPARAEDLYLQANTTSGVATGVGALGLASFALGWTVPW